MSAAMAPAVEEAREHVRQSDFAHLDETGWMERLRKAWMWTAVAGLVAVFTIAKSRGSVVAREILGEDFVGSDRRDWFNMCVARYYGVRTIASAPRIMT